GPAVVEDVFALRVVLEEERQYADRCTGCIVEQQVLRLPAGAAGRGAGLLGGEEEGVIDEGVVDDAGMARRKTVPDLGGNIRRGTDDAGAEDCLSHLAVRTPRRRSGRPGPSRRAPPPE